MNREKEVKAYLEGKLSQAEKLKYEIADEMGVLDKVIKDGWKSLSDKRNRTDRWSYEQKRRNIKSKIQPEGTRRNDAGKVLRAVLNYKKIFLKKEIFLTVQGGLTSGKELYCWNNRGGMKEHG